MLLLMDTALLVHGFAGTGASWDQLVEYLDRQRYRPLAADLRGHGQNDSRRPITFEDCIADLLSAAPERFTLVGYSLGGRLALQLALAAPQRLERLVLISTSAGIDNEAEREVRLNSDLALADDLEQGSIQGFADSWLAAPLFADDPPQVQLAARTEIEKNNPSDLACALRGLSVGRMTPLWSRLSELSVPTTVIAGDRDRAYVKQAERLQSSITGSELKLVEGAGHALPRSAPAELAALL